MSGCDVLITGATGFVGRHLVERARNRGLEVAVASGDLRDEQTVRQEIVRTRPAAIAHLAFSRIEPQTHPALALRENVALIGNVLSALAELRHDAAVLIPGSSAEYGMAEDGPIDENAALAPITPYGELKRLLEMVALAPALRGDVRVVWTRSFNHVGPGQRLDAPVANWAKQLAEAERADGGVISTGNLDVTRDFLDVRDIADLYLDLLGGPAHGVVNVCSGSAISLGEVLERLLALSTVSVDVSTDPQWLRAPDPPTVVGDATRLRELTQRRPMYGLEQSLADVLAEWRAAVVTKDRRTAARR